MQHGIAPDFERMEPSNSPPLEVRERNRPRLNRLH